MLTLTGPAQFVTTGDALEHGLNAIGTLLEARAEACIPGYRLAELTVVGPRSNSAVADLLRDVGENVVFEHADAVAWGVWLPDDFDPAQAPVAQIFRFLPHLGKRPVLISENRMRPGELLVVGDASDFVLTLVSVAEDSAVCDLRWYVWRGKKPAAAPGVNEASLPEVSNPDHVMFEEGRFFELPNAWLPRANGPFAAEHFAQAFSMQIGPMLNPSMAAAFADALSTAPWTRRSGDIYTQDSLDIVAWSRADAPAVVRDVVEFISQASTIERIVEITGVPVTHLRELFAYRLLADERILNHADTTFGGELLVRVNWLVAVPAPREWDLRFWSPDREQTSGVQYRAIANRAVIFAIGPHTPHDVAPLRTGSTPRLNIVLTFGLAPQNRVAVTI